jgi:hypothetical protein
MKLFERMTERLKAFIAQRDDVALVIRCREAEGAVMLKTLEELQDGASSEMFWIFAEEFSSAGEYVRAVVGHFAATHEAVRLSQEKEGEPAWPALPKVVRDETVPPAQRMRELMVFARSLLPQPGLVLVWVLFPLSISGGPAYVSFVQELLKHEFPFPWCHHIRILVRDGARPALAERLGKPPRVAWYEPDLSPKAIEKALDEDLADDSLPLDQQMNSLLITAAMDYSQKRHDRALAKYQLLLRFYQGTGNPTMSALVLNAIGEVFLAKEKLAEANECFLAAVIPATAGNPPPVPVLTNVIWNLASLRVKDKNWPEAEGYWNELQKLATIQRNPPLKVLALEQLGVAQYEQKKVAPALETWRAGAAVAAKLHLPEQRDAILGRLRRHYGKTGENTKLKELESQLATAPAAA